MLQAFFEVNNKKSQ